MAAVTRQLVVRGRWLLVGGRRVVLAVRALGGRMARVRPACPPAHVERRGAARAELGPEGR